MKVSPMAEKMSISDSVRAPWGCATLSHSAAASVASARLGQQPPVLHETGASGLPSVIKRIESARSGCRSRADLAYVHAPRSAAAVGVSPVGMRELREEITGS